MTPPIKFYFDLMSPPSRALMTFFKLANIPVEEHPLSLGNKDHLTDEFKRDIGQLQQLPVIQDGDFSLSEAVAILRYITKKFPVDDFWYPAEPQERARVDEYLDWSIHNMNSLGANSKDPIMSFYSRFRDPILVTSTEFEGNEDLLKNLRRALDELEEFWTGTVYISGEKFSVADVFAICDVEQTRVTGVDPLANRPGLTAWYNRTREHLEPHFQEIHKNVKSAEQKK